MNQGDLERIATEECANSGSHKYMLKNCTACKDGVPTWTGDAYNPSDD
jgi:hypothetical protein